ncbi:hypothetical protein BC937DRAFT_95546 [Endogone sp. FLAS-F59071]|nr:hypothetical protein BC937DRAFT_95546 [Endogone sp. FLAS-F59071]|eukprot:RUS20283.1 hypothetical protein BC937DRAFT_95546 [Endogone sp. FLAS-F59071]
MSFGTFGGSSSCIRILRCGYNTAVSPASSPSFPLPLAGNTDEGTDVGLTTLEQLLDGSGDVRVLDDNGLVEAREERTTSDGQGENLGVDLGNRGLREGGIRGGEGTLNSLKSRTRFGGVVARAGAPAFVALVSSGAAWRISRIIILVPCPPRGGCESPNKRRTDGLQADQNRS